MGLFRCRTCEAKDAEIDRLSKLVARMTSLVEDGQRRIAELAEPGINARLASVRRFEERPASARVVARERIPTFPGYPPEYKEVVEVEGT
jgi:hypothetical protein